MKIVELKIVCYDEDSEIISKEMENSLVAQSGVYTLDCGGIRNLTEDEQEEVEANISDPSVLFDEEN